MNKKKFDMREEIQWTMEYFTASGEPIGLRVGHRLHHPSGKYIGTFNDEGELFNKNGEYIGEVYRNMDAGAFYNRIVVAISKIGKMGDKLDCADNGGYITQGPVKEIAIEEWEYNDFKLS